MTGFLRTKGLVEEGPAWKCRAGSTEQREPVASARSALRAHLPTFVRVVNEGLYNCSGAVMIHVVNLTDPKETKMNREIHVVDQGTYGWSCQLRGRAVGDEVIVAGDRLEMVNDFGETVEMKVKGRKIQSGYDGLCGGTQYTYRRQAVREFVVRKRDRNQFGRTVLVLEEI